MHQTMREMPRYVSHKTVWALKIAEFDVATLTITPADEGFAPFVVEREYVEKHRPQAGGYYVVYSDGYKSYSPAKAFAEGYKLIGSPLIIDVETRVMGVEREEAHA